MLFALVFRALPDDAFITLDYARNLADHMHWGLLEGRSANTQTSPLNAGLLAALIAVTRHPLLAVGLLLVATMAVVGWIASRTAARVSVSAVFPLVLVVLLASSPLLTATVGLETYLGVAVLLANAYAARWSGALTSGLLSGLAVLVRPDLAVPVAALVLLLRPSGSRVRDLVVSAGVAAAVALPWHLFAWRFLGGFVPDTFAFKTASSSLTMATAPLTFYGRLYPTATAVAAVPVVVGVAVTAWAVVRWREPWARLAVAFVVAGWAHWLALVAIDALPQAWYFGPLVACSSVTCALAAARLGRSGVVAGAVALGAFSLGLGGAVPWTDAPMMTNYAGDEDYRRVAEDLRALTGGAPVAGPGEIGVLAYYSEVPVVDFFGDRALARPYLDGRVAEAGPVLTRLFRLNWRYRPDAPTPDLQYRLTYASLTPTPPGRVIATWPVSSPARGEDEVLLSVE